MLWYSLLSCAPVLRMKSRRLCTQPVSMMSVRGRLEMPGDWLTTMESRLHNVDIYGFGCAMRSYCHQVLQGKNYASKQVIKCANENVKNQLTLAKMSPFNKSFQPCQRKVKDSRKASMTTTLFSCSACAVLRSEPIITSISKSANNADELQRRTILDWTDKTHTHTHTNKQRERRTAMTY